jgi:hypothetical protein
VVGLVERVTGVNADPDADRRRVVGEGTTELALDCPCLGDRPPCAGEREHGSVALGLDNLAVVCCGGVCDHGVVPSEEIEPGCVSDRSCDGFDEQV